MGQLLTIQIELKRLEMITMGITKGLSDATTIRLSEELDALLNQLDYETQNYQLTSQLGQYR